jgi:hypothetical protein
MTSEFDTEKAAKVGPIAPVALDPSVHEGIHEGKASNAAADIVHAAESEYTAEQYKKILRKADWVLLPLMWIVSGTQYADKVSISTQATFGLTTDTHLVGQQYSCKLFSAMYPLPPMLGYSLSCWQPLLRLMTY